MSAHPAASMRLYELTPEHLHIESRFWTDSRRADFMNTVSAVHIAIVSALTKEGIALPHPDERQVTIVEPPGMEYSRGATNG